MTSLLRFDFKSIARHPRIRGGIWIFAAFALRIVCQAVLFFLLARLMGPAGYGALAAAAAVSAIAAPYVGWGSGNLLIQDVARNHQHFRRRWGSSILALLISGLPLFALVIAFAALFLDNIPLQVVLYIALAELFFARALDIASQAYQALDRFTRVAQLQVLPHASRLLAVILFASLGTAHTPSAWALLYLASTAAVAALGVLLVNRELGTPTFDFAGIKADIRTGYHFSVSLSAQTVYNDIDKAMLARMATTVAVGTYAAAYRIVDVAFVPVRAMLFSTYSEFFRNGANGLRASTEYARKLLPAAAGYALAASIGLLAVAPLIPYVLGSGFADTAAALRWLALLPMLKSLHYMAADALTGAGYQYVRSRVQILIAAINIAANLYLIPRYSWRGAAWASLLCDALLGVALWICVLRLLRTPTRTLQVSLRPDEV